MAPLSACWDTSNVSEPCRGPSSLTAFNNGCRNRSLTQMCPKFDVLRFSIAILLLWMCASSFTVEVSAQKWQYSSNPDDYDFGWIANGTYDPGAVPVCTYCLNTKQPPGLSPDDPEVGNYWNRTVVMYRCDGAQQNERWSYHKPTHAILVWNVTRVLCIDSATLRTFGSLTLQDCNSSLPSQRWTFSGNRVISGSSVGNGTSLFLLGQLPDKGRDPLKQQYEFPLTVSSSLPLGDGSVGYTDTFTFLSFKNLLNTSTQKFTTEGLLRLTNNSLSHVVNGDFETSTIQAGADITWSDWDMRVSSYLALCGWVIETGPIDYVKAGLLPPASGSYSIHLNTHTHTDFWGSISQTVMTEVGKEYNLSFYTTAFPPGVNVTSRSNWSCSPSYTQAILQMRITGSTPSAPNTDHANVTGGALQERGSLIQNFSTTVPKGTTRIPWQQKFVIFRASTNVTTISFKSLNFNNSCGPMIDAVNLSPSHSSGSKSRMTRTLLGAIGGPAILLVIVAAFMGFLYRKRRYEEEHDYILSGLYKTENAKVFSVRELSNATKKFSLVLGAGGFGTVYKAEFPDGTVGAVKVEKPKGPHSSSKFLASDEIAVLLRVHHRNLVNLTGFCIHKGRHMLVFEYLPHGSLHDRLHKSVVTPPPGPPGSTTEYIDLSEVYAKVLPWERRVKIACDVAYGLEYLHYDADPPIVHRDVKSQNVLLTASDSAKLADFGLSKIAPMDATSFQSVETMVRGSIGYMDPQYFLTGVFSPKSDVYSYGVVLLELITGHQGIHNAVSLTSWARPYLTDPATYPEIVDEKLGGKFETNELESLIELSKMCLKEDGKMRPNMRQVVGFLNAKQLVVAGAESSEQVDSTIITREAYHKMHPVLVDFDETKAESSYTNSSDLMTSYAGDMSVMPRD